MSVPIVKTVFSLATSPSPTWKELAEKRPETNQAFFTSFLYPLMGWVTIASILSIYMHADQPELGVAIKRATVTFIELFLGFFLSSFVLNKVLVRFFNKKDNLERVQYFVGIVSSISYCSTVVLLLFPSLFFFKFTFLFSAYIIWLGGGAYYMMTPKVSLRFMVVAIAIMMISPMIIGKLMTIFMPNLS